MKTNRTFARASHATFTIPPIRKLLEGLEDYHLGTLKGWADPFAGHNSPAEYTNDIDPTTPAKYHLEADEFGKIAPSVLSGVLFDPPYSYRQIKEHNAGLGKKPTQKDTSYNFYRRAMNAIIPKIKVGGYAISFGWNSNGFGKKYGFEIVEILLVAHGMHHNDTIVTIERKI